MDTTEKTETKQKKRGNVANLKPFKPGESGNPAGRPKGSVSITEAIKRKLEQEYYDIDNPEDKKTYLEKIIDSIFHNALVLKDAKTLKDIWSYIDGMPKGTVELDVDKDNLKALTDFFRSASKVTQEDGTDTVS